MFPKHLQPVGMLCQFQHQLVSLSQPVPVPVRGLPCCVRAVLSSSAHQASLRCFCTTSLTTQPGTVFSTINTFATSKTLARNQSHSNTVFTSALASYAIS